MVYVQLQARQIAPHDHARLIMVWEPIVVFDDLPAASSIKPHRGSLALVRREDRGAIGETGEERVVEFATDTASLRL